MQGYWIAKVARAQDEFSLNGLELSEVKQIRRLEFLSYLEEKNMESITQGDRTKHG
jgi:hypothetical protein